MNKVMRRAITPIVAEILEAFVRITRFTSLPVCVKALLRLSRKRYKSVKPVTAAVNSEQAFMKKPFKTAARILRAAVNRHICPKGFRILFDGKDGKIFSGHLVKIHRTANMANAKL